MNRVVQQGFLPLLKTLGWGNLVQEVIEEEREDPETAFDSLDGMKGSIEHWTGTLESVVVISDRFSTDREGNEGKDYATAVKLPCGVVLGISRATAERLQQRLDEATGDVLDTPWPLAMTREGYALTPDESVVKSFGMLEIGQPLQFSGSLYIFPEPDRSFVVEFSRVAPRKSQ